MPAKTQLVCLAFLEVPSRRLVEAISVASENVEFVFQGAVRIEYVPASGFFARSRRSPASRETDFGPSALRRKRDVTHCLPTPYDMCGRAASLQTRVHTGEHRQQLLTVDCLRKLRRIRTSVKRRHGPQEQADSHSVECGGLPTEEAAGGARREPAAATEGSPPVGALAERAGNTSGRQEFVGDGEVCERKASGGRPREVVAAVDKNQKDDSVEDVLVVGLVESWSVYPEEGRTFAFGHAAPEWGVAVVSTADFATADRGQLGLRLAKVLVHEIGHLRGLLHCMQLDCRMKPAVDPADLDSSGLELCADCAKNSKDLT